jgi:cell division protein FtsQ
MRSLNPWARAASAAPRRDPAPSRWSYRLHRLWLTPLVRRLARVGLPAFALAMSAGLFLSDDARRAAIVTQAQSLRDAVKNRPEFMVTLVRIEGASPPLAELVRAALALPLPQSSLDLDLAAARDRVAALPPVAAATLRVESGGVLAVTVEEREPAFVWRAPEGLILLGAEGHRIAGIDARSLRPDLPLLAGAGVDVAAAEAEALILAAGPILPRLRGLVRVGERRWDLVLDRDQRILLPAENPLPALERLLALDAAEQVLARDITAVDLRLAERPALRLAPDALAEVRRRQGIIPEESAL